VKDTHHFTLDGLDEDTTYLVQVQAISAYGDRRLKSERIGTYITTMAIQQATQIVRGESLILSTAIPPDIIVIKTLHKLPPLKEIIPQDAYFHNGLVKANISWTLPDGYEEEPEVLLHWLPEVCIADNNGASSLSKAMSDTKQGTSFIIYDLRFDCRYVVKAQLVSIGGSVGPVSYITFQTPSCGNIEVEGDLLPDCPTNIPRVPEEPHGLHHSFLIKNTNITARISWRHPQSDAPIQGYRIIWGQLLHNTDDVNMDKKTALTKVLSKGSTSFSISNLQEAISYLVNLQAFSHAGSGKSSSLNFRTPVLQPQPIAPPYKIDKTEIELAPPLLEEDSLELDISSTVVASSSEPALHNSAEESSQTSHAIHIHSLRLLGLATTLLVILCSF
jgi:hypothetical protein